MLTFYKLGTIEFPTAAQDNLTQIVHCWLLDPNRKSKLIGYINPYIYNLACHDISVKQFLSNSDLVCVDGIGISLSARLFYGLHLQRVVATHLFEAILDYHDINTCAILIGVTENEVQIAMNAINKRSHGLQIIAAYHGFYDKVSYNQILHMHSDIDAILVGMGTPKSEQILLQAMQICKRALCWHIGGGTIRLYAGTKRRAPIWLSKLGCEWIHRLIYEPGVRSRYISGGIEFAQNIACSFTKQPRTKTTKDNRET
jgi:N-acetylglucosaminyldiphosphoundecaprenol N-acetyl-beta-D-mannosaminyltransferase